MVDPGWQRVPPLSPRDVNELSLQLLSVLVRDVGPNFSETFKRKIRRSHGKKEDSDRNKDFENFMMISSNNHTKGKSDVPQDKQVYNHVESTYKNRIW